jgi:hypothetical protein
MNDKTNIETEFNREFRKNPFRTPDGYFDSMEDRILAGIKESAKPKNKKTEIIRFLKPILGLAASFTIVYLLVYYPINYLMSKSGAQAEITQSQSTDVFDAYSLNIGSIDENSLADLLFSDQTLNGSLIGSDEVLVYLSSELNEFDIVSEIQNNNQ